MTAKEENEWEELGERLREAREYRGYSQEEIAEYLDISRSAVSLMENGSRKVDTIELRRLAELYEVTIDKLVGQTAGPNEKNEDIQMVARATQDLTPEDRKEVLRFAEFLQSKRARRESDESEN